MSYGSYSVQGFVLSSLKLCPGPPGRGWRGLFGVYSWVVVKIMVPFCFGSLIYYGTDYLGYPKKGP